jgi:hypothetical protein
VYPKHIPPAIYFRRKEKMEITQKELLRLMLEAQDGEPHGVLTCDLKDGEFKNGRRDNG